MNEVNEISDDYAIKIFKLRFFILYSLVLFCPIGLYTLFIYSYKPELLWLSIAVGIALYIICVPLSFVWINSTLKNNEEYREKIIKATKQNIENKIKNRK